jgi:hypothetical protein
LATVTVIESLVVLPKPILDVTVGLLVAYIQVSTVFGTSRTCQLKLLQHSDIEASHQWRRRVNVWLRLCVLLLSSNLPLGMQISATAARKLMEMLRQTSALVGGDLCHGSTRLSSTLFLLYIHWPSAYIFPSKQSYRKPVLFSRRHFYETNVYQDKFKRKVIPYGNTHWTAS